MPLPNFVMIGPPKCGTSSVFRWLSAHPRACGSAVKETFYLMDAAHPLLPARNVHEGGREGYERLFQHCSGAQVCFEATTHYLFQDTARETLAALPSRPSVLVLLREPASRVYSSFRYTRDTLALLDRSVTFRAYVEAMRRGDRTFLETRCVSASSRYVLERDIEYSRYALWLEPWFRELGRERVWVALFDAVIREPARFMRDLVARLGIDPQELPEEFGAHNATVRARVPWLQRWARAVAKRHRWAGVKQLGRLYRALAVERAAAPTDDDQLVLDELAREYDTFNDELAALTGMDLGLWARTERRS